MSLLAPRAVCDPESPGFVLFDEGYLTLAYGRSAKLSLEDEFSRFSPGVESFSLVFIPRPSLEFDRYLVIPVFSAGALASSLFASF